jgi:hypothetical protein
VGKDPDGESGTRPVKLEFIEYLCERSQMLTPDEMEEYSRFVPAVCQPMSEVIFWRQHGIRR